MSDTLTLYHNPRCSKSRQALKMVQASGEPFETVLYMDNLLSASDIQELLMRLNFESPRQLMRKGEAIYKDLELASIDDETALITAMAAHPKLIERPILARGDEAVLGRPPENVQVFLKK